MSYQVIARKWRPKDFSELIGQEHISQTLINALRNDRMPHAILFTGPRGTGKTSSARILAKSVRCPNAKDFVACNACPECEDISTSRSVDVIEIDGASNNGVDAIRELRETVGFMPSSGKFKVYIVDEVHMLTTSAFNALLKTLEEPPAHVLFILATTEVQKIPATVLSRCQRYDFRRISTKVITEHLKHICETEKFEADSDALWAIARQGDGSMRDSQSLLDQIVSFSQGKVTLKIVASILGLTDRSLLTDTISAIVERNTKNMGSVIERLLIAGYEPVIFMKDLLEEIRHLVMLKSAESALENIVDLPAEELQKLKTLGAKITNEDVHIMFDMALKGASDLHKAHDPQIVLEMILMRLLIAPRINELFRANATTTTAAAHNSQPMTAGNVSQSATPVRSANPSEKKSIPNFAASLSAQQDNQSPPSHPGGAAANVSFAGGAGATSQNHMHSSGPLASDMPSRSSAANNGPWPDFVDRVRKVNGLVAAQLDQLHMLSNKDKVVHLGVPEKYQFLMSQTSDPNFQKKLVNYLNTFWGPGHSVKIDKIDPATSKTDSPSTLAEKQKESAKNELTRQVEEHPLVRETKSIFNTQIKSIRETP